VYSEPERVLAMVAQAVERCTHVGAAFVVDPITSVGVAHVLVKRGVTCTMFNAAMTPFYRTVQVNL
jgi:2-keto-3-deoxy-6-phosphogluconate aldolase